MSTADNALTSAMLHLRMTLAGHSSYSASPSRIDEGWAALVREELARRGFQVVPTVAQPGLDQPSPDDTEQQAARMQAALKRV